MLATGRSLPHGFGLRLTLDLRGPGRRVLICRTHMVESVFAYLRKNVSNVYPAEPTVVITGMCVSSLLQNTDYLFKS
ncbi:unnamed protein product [Macrosiphum euphorbiae]|uniref:Uncharacterized protein n=1 Tax=Macrosiphum euphorbiae TaxID=13131 RepID=A0AAV0WVC4_9HEMI|nr:unnamed protein product [Macrosiphum euphorbiae]